MENTKSSLPNDNQGTTTGKHEIVQKIFETAHLYTKGSEMYIKIIIGLLAVLVALKLWKRIPKICSKFRMKLNWHFQKDKLHLKRLAFQNASSDTLDSVLSTKPIITYKAHLQENAPTADYRMMQGSRRTYSGAHNIPSVRVPTITSLSSMHRSCEEEKKAYENQKPSTCTKSILPSQGTKHETRSKHDQMEVYSLAKNPVLESKITGMETSGKLLFAHGSTQAPNSRTDEISKTPKEVYSLAKAPSSELISGVKDVQSQSYEGKMIQTGHSDEDRHKSVPLCGFLQKDNPSSNTTQLPLKVSKETKDSLLKEKNYNQNASRKETSCESHVEDAYHFAAATEIVSANYDLAISSRMENNTKDNVLNQTADEDISSDTREPSEEENETDCDVRLSFVVPKFSNLHY